MSNFKRKYYFLIILLILLFITFFNISNIYSQTKLKILSKERVNFQKAYKFKNNYYIIEYFFNDNLEYIVSKYYIEQFLLPVFINKGFKEISISDVVKIPQLRMENMMPQNVNFKIFKELYYDIIDIGSLSYNYQILVVFSKKFGNNYLLRLFEFKLFNIEHNPPNFISGGVYLEVTNTEFKILKEF